MTGVFQIGTHTYVLHIRLFICTYLRDRARVCVSLYEKYASAKWDIVYDRAHEPDVSKRRKKVMVGKNWSLLYPEQRGNFATNWSCPIKIDGIPNLSKLPLRLNWPINIGDVYSYLNEATIYKTYLRQHLQ